MLKGRPEHARGRGKRQEGRERGVIGGQIDQGKHLGGEGRSRKEKQDTQLKTDNLPLWGVFLPWWGGMKKKEWIVDPEKRVGEWDIGGPRDSAR